MPILQPRPAVRSHLGPPSRGQKHMSTEFQPRVQLLAPVHSTTTVLTVRLCYSWMMYHACRVTAAVRTAANAVDVCACTSVVRDWFLMQAAVTEPRPQNGCSPAWCCRAGRVYSATSLAVSLWARQTTGFSGGMASRASSQRPRARRVGMAGACARVCARRRVSGHERRAPAPALGPLRPGLVHKTGRPGSLATTSRACPTGARRGGPVGLLAGPLLEAAPQADGADASVDGGSGPADPLLGALVVSLDALGEGGDAVLWTGSFQFPVAGGGGRVGERSDTRQGMRGRREGGGGHPGGRVARMAVEQAPCKLRRGGARARRTRWDLQGKGWSV
jgi:hypothetical protein